MVLDNNSSRLLIYFFYDKNGVVDDYIPYVLTDMQKNVSDIFVVCNGLLTDEGKIRMPWKSLVGRHLEIMMKLY